MQAMRPLPAREPLLPGESLSSLVRRTAEAMGYENLARIRSLLKEAGDLPAHFSQLQPGPVWDQLGHLLKQPAEQIKLATVHHYANRFILVSHNEPLADWCDSKAALRFFSFGRAPVCPRCFDEDEHSYERLCWSLRPLPVCMQHNSRLISTCPKCTRPLRPSRLQANVCQCGFDIRHAKARLLTDLELRLFRSAEGWFDGGNLPLNGMNACPLSVNLRFNGAAMWNRMLTAAGPSICPRSKVRRWDHFGCAHRHLRPNINGLNCIG